MGNSQFKNCIFELRTQRCFIRYANGTFKTTEGYCYQF